MLVRAITFRCVACLVLLTSCRVAWSQVEDKRMGPKTVDYMIEAIRVEPLNDKMQAAVSLGVARVDRPEALKALLSLLESEYPPARISALYALGRSRAESVIPAVVGRLGDDDENVRIEACRALAEADAGGHSAKLPLGDPSAVVRLAAAEAAGMLGNDAIARELIARFAEETEADVRAALLNALARLAYAEAAEAATRGLADDALCVRLAALDWFAAVPTPDAKDAQARVTTMLADRVSLTRRSAVRALANIAGDDAIPRLVPLAADADHTVRRALGDVLGRRTPSVDVRGTLSRLATDTAREVRRSASLSLVTHARGDDVLRGEVERIAVELTRNAESAARREGLWILGTLESKAAFPAVLERAVRTVEVDADGKPTTDLRESRLVAWVVGQTAYEPGTDLMMTYFRQTVDDALRAHSARALGVLKHMDAVPVLCKAVLEIGVDAGMKFYVFGGYARTVTIRTLGELADDQALAALTKIIGTLDPAETEENVKEVCDILVKSRYTKAAPTLKATIADPVCVPEAAVVLADAVKGLTGEVVPVRPVTSVSPYSDFFINAREDHEPPAE